jgi:hypothetical protein
VDFFFNLPNPTNCAMALGSTELLTEMSTGNLSEGKGRPTRKADNKSAVEPLVNGMIYLIHSVSNVNLSISTITDVQIIVTQD